VRTAVAAACLALVIVGLSLQLTKRAAGQTVRIVATATFDGRQIESASRRIGVRS